MGRLVHCVNYQIATITVKGMDLCFSSKKKPQFSQFKRDLWGGSAFKVLKSAKKWLWMEFHRAEDEAIETLTIPLMRQLKTPVLSILW